MTKADAPVDGRTRISRRNKILLAAAGVLLAIPAIAQAILLP